MGDNARAHRFGIWWGATKTGATTLARLDGGPESSGGSENPLLVFHRYGRGITTAFLTGSSWRWQMLQDHQGPESRDLLAAVAALVGPLGKGPSLG